jgi:hypothetical protein
MTIVRCTQSNMLQNIELESLKTVRLWTPPAPSQGLIAGTLGAPGSQVITNQFPSGCNKNGFSPPGDGFNGYANSRELLLLCQTVCQPDMLHLLLRLYR